MSALIGIPGSRVSPAPSLWETVRQKANPGTHWHVIAHVPSSPASLPLLSVFQNLPTFALYMMSKTVRGERDREQCVYFICLEPQVL